MEHWAADDYGWPIRPVLLHADPDGPTTSQLVYKGRDKVYAEDYERIWLDAPAHAPREHASTPFDDGEQDATGLHDDIALGVGVVDIKDNEVASADEIARRIERAVRVLGADRVRWVHPNCGFWMQLRGVADRKMIVLGQGRDTFLGQGR